MPLLVFADLVAVRTYLRDASWPHLVRLFPWAVTGIIVGFFAVDWINDRQTAHLIGAILVVLVGIQVWRSHDSLLKHKTPEAGNGDVPHNVWFSASMGMLAGFTTMVANAAGPIMNLYLLAKRMRKAEFMGTAAWYFLILNSFKLPFSWKLGLIHRDSLLFDLKLAPFALIGAFTGRALIKRIDQRTFELIALLLAFIAGLRLLF